MNSRALRAITYGSTKPFMPPKLHKLPFQQHASKSLGYNEELKTLQGKLGKKSNTHHILIIIEKNVSDKKVQNGGLSPIKSTIKRIPDNLLS